MAHTVSISKSLLLSMLSVILLLSGGIMATTYIGSQRTLESLSAALISQALGKTEERLHRFFDPATQELLLAQAWGNAGIIDVDNPKALKHFFEPLIRQHPQISSLLIADNRGHEFMLLHRGDEWMSRQTRHDEWNGRTRWLEWSDGHHEPVESWRESLYDPRVRPWYRGAITKQRRAVSTNQLISKDELLHWTEPYTFFTTKAPGITASIAFKSDGGMEQVIGFDMLLSDISIFTAGLHVTEHGVVMVLTDDGRIIGLPSNSRFDDGDAGRAALLKRPEELEWPLASDAEEALASRTPGDRGPIRFLSGNSAWWSELRPFKLSPDRNFSIAVMVPESDLLGGIVQIRKWIILITLGVLALALIYIMVLARRYSRPIEALVRQSNRIRKGDLEQGEPIRSRCTEVNALAEAQDRMRAKLQIILRLESDLQLAHQIQQKTFPKKLPKLSEYEIEAWSEAADETGGDTYDVIRLQDNSLDNSVEPAERIILLLADATGHGVGPALLATEIRSMLRMAVRMGGNLPTIVRHMNEQLFADLYGGRFITAWLGELDGDLHTLTNFSAGQAPLLHYDAKSGNFNVFDADTLPLGVVTDLKITLPDPIQINPGDIFAVISDGIYESTNRHGERFGVNRVMDVITSYKNASPTNITSAIKEAIVVFTEGAQAADDRTTLLIKRRERTRERNGVD